MSSAFTSPDTPLERFPSLAALLTMHGTLLQRLRQESAAPQLSADVIEFIRIGAATGALFAEDTDRRQAQSALDYWVARLYRLGAEPPDATLAEFNPLFAPDLPDRLCPYLGLDAFREGDSARFFGRRDLISQLLEQLNSQRLIAVVGPSGSGKSSLVRAGLIPALRRGALSGSAQWRYLDPIVPGSTPLAALERLLNRDEAKPTVPGSPALILIIDQFEELFTLCDDESARQTFVARLLALVQTSEPQHRVILTMRSDFETFIARLPVLQPLFSAGRVQVTPLSAAELREAIEQPAEAVGLKFERGVVDLLLQDILGEPAGLPLLQFTLLKLWERRQRNVVTRAAYDLTGGGRLALARSADAFYAELIPEDQVAARRILLRMVRPGAGLEITSNRIRRAELYRAGEDPGRVMRVLERLIDERLVRLTEGEALDDSQVELAHEALVRNWPTLVKWLEEERAAIATRRRFEERAAAWVRLGQGQGGLLDEIELFEAERWLASAEAAYLGYDSLVDELVTASREKIVKRARRVTRLRLAVIILSLTLGVVGIVLSVFTFAQRSQAQQNAAIAEQNAAEARELKRIAEQNAQQALQSANAAATAEAQAQLNAEQARYLALIQGAQAAFNQGNLDLAGALALKAIAQPNSGQGAEQVLATVAYNPNLRLVLNGHSDVVNSVVYSPDETMALSGGRNDKVAILWDLKTGSEIKRFVGHPGRIREVAFLPDGQRVLTASEDGTVRLWDVSCASASPTECDQPTRIFIDTAAYQARPFEVKGIAVRPGRNQFITANSDYTLKLWDLDCATPSAQLCETPMRVFAAGNGGHTLEANLVTFSPDGNRALSSSEDATIVLWDVETGAPIRKMTDPNNAEIRGVAILPDGRTALSGGAAGELDKWDLETGQLVDRLRGHKGTIYNVALNDNGSQAITGSADNTVIVWDLYKNVPATVLRGHSGYIRQAVLSKDGKQALSGSQDKTIRVWDLFNGAEDLRLKSSAQTNTISVSADGSRIATGNDDSTIVIWDAKTGEEQVTYHWHEREVTAVALSPDGSFVLSGGGKADGALLMTDLTNQQFVDRFKFRTFNINAIVFTPDGKQVVTAQGIPDYYDYNDGRVTNRDLLNISLILWDVASGEPVWKVTDVMVDDQRHDSINSVVISPDGRTIYGSTGAGSKILKFDRATGKQTGALNLGNDGKATQLAMTPDGKFLVAGTSNKVFIVWDLASDKRVWRSPEQAAQISTVTMTSVAITANGRYVAATADSEVAIWDLQSGEKIRSFIGHARNINQLAFIDGDTRLVSASADGTARVWRFESREQLIAWVKANRQYPELDCDQAKIYFLTCN